MPMSMLPQVRPLRSVTRSSARGGFLGLLGLLALACGQGEGDRCEIDSDCNEGRCEVTNQNGICRSNPTPVVIPVVDAAAPPTPSPDTAKPADAGAPDVTVDAATTPDVPQTPAADAPVDRPADATVDASDGGAQG
jgi:hypothetical protein